MKTIRNLFYNASYQLLITLIPLLTQPYISRVLQPEGNGIYTYTWSIIQYFVLVGDLGITLYGNREIAYHRNDKHKRSQIFWEIEILQLCTTAISIVIFFVFLHFDHQYYLFQLLQIIWLIAQGIDISWYFMGLEDFKKTVLRNTLVKAVSVLLIFMLIHTPGDLWKYIVIQGGAQLIGGVSLWPYLKGSVERVSVSLNAVLSHLYPAFVLFIPNIAIQVYAVVNRTMLKQFDSTVSAGYFNFSDSLVKTVLSVVTATGTVMLPHIANKFAQGDMRAVNNSLYRNMNFVSAISVPMTFGLAALSTKLAPWFFGQQYASVGELIFFESPIILLIAWSTVVGRQYLMPTKQIRAYTISVTLGAVANIIINVPLILTIGASGAAIATVISEALVTAYQVFAIRGAVELRRMFVGLWKYLLSGVLMFAVVSFINQRISMSFIHLGIEVAIGVVVYVVGVMLTRAYIVEEVRRLIRTRFH
ncbi:flippase [Furfurilactobacillus sp. WILCCON 0119]|uniref:flippase n=1 Tax=Furfurilactobacillus entadae TaxID=2922307 RepID=UPI0035E7759A